MKNAKDILGKIIRCKRCNESQAQITLEDRQYWVNCACCGDKTLLKWYSKNS